MADLALTLHDASYRFNPSAGPMQDTTAQTSWIMAQVDGCGTDAAACAAGFAAVCALPQEQIPGNCNVFCGPTGSVSCNQPLIQDANGVWSLAPVAAAN